MSGCCNHDCSLEQLRERQHGTLHIVLAINALIFLIIVAAAHYAKSSALLANSLDNLRDALTYGRTRPVLNTPSDGVITHAWNTGAM